MLVAEQCKAARAAIGWSVRDLARVATVAPDTVARFERDDPWERPTGPKVKASTVEKLQRALQEGGIHLKFGQTRGIEIRPRLMSPRLIGDVYVFDCIHKGKKLEVRGKKKDIEVFVAASDRLNPINSRFEGLFRILAYVERKVSNLLVVERRKIRGRVFWLSRGDLIAQRPDWLK
jgi:transcriptional regulator with XRE-family HTH domain